MNCFFSYPDVFVPFGGMGRDSCSGVSRQAGLNDGVKYVRVGASLSGARLDRP